MKPIITITTACYNSEKTISDTIESVLNQTYKDFEYWIIDGGSTDNTISIIKNYMRKSEKIHLISEPDNGMYDAINKGIKASSGEIIGNLNSDDCYVSDCLQMVADRYKKENNSLLVINGYMDRVDEEGNIVHSYRYDSSHIKNKKCFGHPAMFVSRKVFEVVGLYDATYRLCADGEWQYRVYDNPQIKYVIEERVFTRMRAGGATDQFDKRWIWYKELVRMKKEHHTDAIIIIHIKVFINLINMCVKSLIPKRFQRQAYSLIYRLRDKC